MAKIIKVVDPPHPCLSEIDRDIDTPSLGLGSVVQCSCGKQFMLHQSPRDDVYWELIVRLPVPGGLGS